MFQASMIVFHVNLQERTKAAYFWLLTRAQAHIVPVPKITTFLQGGKIFCFIHMCPPQKLFQNSLPWQCAKTVILTQIVHSLRMFFHVSLLFPQQAAVTQQTFICSSVSVTHNVCQSLPLRNQKIKKKQKTKPMGWKKSAGLGFVIFFWFSRGFSYFWWKTWNTSRKPKKPKWHTPTPQIFSIPWVCFFLFFLVFSRFLLLFRETKKTQRKHAVQYSDYHIRLWVLRQPLPKPIWKISPDLPISVATFCDSRPLLLRDILCPCHP